MNIIITLTSKRQATFPKKLLDILGADKGDKMLAKIQQGKVVLEPIKAGLSDLQGSLAKTAIGKKYSLEEVVERAKKKEVKRIIEES